MPLVKSASKEAVSENIRRERAAGKPQKQAVAIALAVQHRAKRQRLAVGGISDVSQGNWWNHQQGDPVIEHGLVPGASSGRADALDLSVPKGSYILPADVVSALGEGNTASGSGYLDKLFGRAGSGGFAAGGRATSPMIPVQLSAGEYVVSPQAATAIGQGNLRHGHDVLDAFVHHVRGKHVKTLSKLPGPVK